MTHVIRWAIAILASVGLVTGCCALLVYARLHEEP